MPNRVFPVILRYFSCRTAQFAGILLILSAAPSSVTSAQDAQRPRPVQIGAKAQRPSTERIAQPGAQTAAPQVRQMPSLIDSTESVARAMISRMRFGPPPVITDRPTDDQKRDGLVVDQSPNAGGRLTPTDTIKLTVHRYVPRTTVTVPPVVDSSLAVAVRLLREVKLTPILPRLRREDLRRAVVQEQSPAARTRVDAGSDVTLSVVLRTTVPNVLRAHVSQATSILSDSGLVINIRGEEYSDALGAGGVLRQHPDAGTRSQPGASVDVWVSMGPHPVAPPRLMPRLIGLPFSVASDSIRVYGLRLAHVDSIENATRIGFVTDQKPRAGTAIHAEDAAELQITVAPKPRRVPWTVGMRRDEATRLLADSGFAVRVTMVPDSVRADERVISQFPDSGVPRRPVREVAIEVVDSIGTGQRSIVMPSVIGLSRDQAYEALGFLSPNLTVNERPVSVQTDSGRVVEQRPMAGALVFPAVEATITLGRYEPSQDTATGRTVVPDLTNQSMERARQLLAQANLRVGDVVSSITVAPESVVVSQQPAAGQNVEIGTVVSVTVTTVQDTGTGSGEGNGDPPWFWLIVVPAVGLLLLGIWKLWPKPKPPPPPEPDPPTVPGVSAKLVTRFEPPTLGRDESKSVVAFDLTLVGRVPEVVIEQQGSLIERVRHV